MNTTFAVISLIVLIAAIAVGYFSKLNTGLICIAVAMVLGHIVGMADKAIIAGFGAKLFLQLMGVMFLFSIANENKALEGIAKRAVALAGKRTNLIPLICYFVALVLSAIGCGCVPVMSLMAVFCAALAVEMQCNPILLIPMGLLGAQGGGTTPLTTTGILGASLAADNGIVESVATGLMGGQMIVSTLFAIVLYFILGGHKIKSENPIKMADIPKFTKNQILSLIAILAVAVAVMFFGLDVGLCGFVAGVILLLFKCAPQKAVIAGIPWSTLILVSGVGVLMNVVMTVGGIDLLAQGLASIMTEKTATPLISLTAGVMSWFSSTSGVVMPTLIPTVAPLLEALGETSVTATALVTAITASAHTAGNSPISTGGALGLASYCGLTHCSADEERKLFVKLFGVAALGVVFCVLFAFVGGFSWIA